MVPKGWNESTLGQLSSETISYGIVQTGEHIEDGVPCVRVIDMASGNLDPDQMIRTTSAISASYKKTVLKQNDIMLALRGEIGLVRQVPEDLVGCNLTRGIARISPQESLVDSRYLLWALRSTISRRDMLRRVNGSALQEIPLAELRKVKILSPKTQEQECLAAILDCWEVSVTLIERLIKNSRVQIQALMQQLLMGKRRLPGFVASGGRQSTKYGDIPTDWDFLHIAEIADEASERNESGLDHPVLSCSKHEGFVNSLEYFKKKVYSDDTTNYKVIRNEDFGFPSNHIEEGSIGYQSLCEVGIVSPIYTIFRTNEAMHDGYLYKLLKTEHYRQIFAANTNASVDRRGSLRWKEFSKIRVPVPSYEEQVAISAVIDQAEAIRDNYENQKASLESQKKALMQQLLTGKRRIKVDKAAA